MSSPLAVATATVSHAIEAVAHRKNKAPAQGKKLPPRASFHKREGDDMRPFKAFLFLSLSEFVEIVVGAAVATILLAVALFAIFMIAGNVSTIIMAFLELACVLADISLVVLILRCRQNRRKKAVLRELHLLCEG